MFFNLLDITQLYCKGFHIFIVTTPFMCSCIIIVITCYGVLYLQISNIPIVYKISLDSIMAMISTKSLFACPLEVDIIL